MITPGGRGKHGVALALVATAVALLLVVSGVTAYYLVVSPRGAGNSSGTESQTSASCADSASSCVEAVSNTTSTAVSNGALVLSGVKVTSLCYVTNCGSLPMVEVTFSLTNLSPTDGTIISLNITCDGCGIGGGLNHEGYSLAAVLGGYGNESAYRCQTGTSEFDNVPPGNTSYEVLCDGPGSAFVINPYYYRLAVCIPGNVSSSGACDQATTDFAIPVNAAPYGSHLLPARHLCAERPLGLNGTVVGLPADCPGEAAVPRTSSSSS